MKQDRGDAADLLCHEQDPESSVFKACLSELASKTLSGTVTLGQTEVQDAHVVRYRVGSVVVVLDLLVARSRIRGCSVRRSLICSKASCANGRVTRVSAERKRRQAWTH